MKTTIIIPARLESKRLNRKLLLPGPGNQPLLYFTWKQAVQSRVDHTYITTDNTEIAHEATKFGAEVIMTGHHNCGTNRVAEAYSKIMTPSDDSETECIINLQGDEPEIRNKDIDLLIEKFRVGPKINYNNSNQPRMFITTLAVPFHNYFQFSKPQNVKVVFDKDDMEAIYFSRGMIPWVDGLHGSIDEWRTSGALPVAYKHIGIYAYTPEMLQEFANAEATRLEKIERLEQMRAIENSWPILVVTVKAPDDDVLNIWPLGVNTDQDYKLWCKRTKSCQK